MIGTLVNVGTVIVGSFMGLLFQKKIPKKLNTISFQAMGLFTLVLGISMSIKINEHLLVLFSLIIGGIIGELLKLDSKIEDLGEKIKQKTNSNNQKFSEGLVTAFLLFCVGSMTILGAIEEGLGQKPNLLITKAIMDGFASIILASTLGRGVLFSVIPLFLFQGGLTLLAFYIEPYLTDIIINEITALGGILLIGLDINILGIKKIKVINLLPSLIFVVILSYYFSA